MTYRDESSRTNNRERGGGGENKKQKEKNKKNKMENGRLSFIAESTDIFHTRTWLWRLSSYSLCKLQEQHQKKIVMKDWGILLEPKFNQKYPVWVSAHFQSKMKKGRLSLFWKSSFSILNMTSLVNPLSLTWFSNSYQKIIPHVGTIFWERKILKGIMSDMNFVLKWWTYIYIYMKRSIQWRDEQICQTKRKCKT